jgi:hypothetical protein
MVAAVERDLESILKLPLTGIQKMLGAKLLGGEFSESERDDIIAQLESIVSGSTKKIFLQEKQNIDQALKDGIAPTEPNLSTPELQLLWAAHLTYLAHHSQPSLHETKLWRQLMECDDAKHELMKHAFYIARDLTNPDTRLNWGVPGSMFYYDPTNNAINIDLVMSLIGGFEDTRSIIFHEIGHSKLTRKFTVEMQKIREEIEAVNKKGETDGLEKEEYARLAGLSTAWKFMHRVFDEAENSPVNRYAINLSGKMTQDYGRSLNIVETTIAEAGDHKLPTDPTPLQKFQNLNRAVRMSLYMNNGLFENTPQGWARVGVRPEWIEALPRTAKGKSLTSKQAFEELLELCGGENGLENLQPSTVDRMKGRDWFDKVTDSYSDKRNAIIENHIWRRYAEPLVQQIIEQAEKQAKQQIDQAQKGQGQQGQGQQGQGQQGQGQQGQGQQGQGQQGQGQQGQGQQGQADEGEPSKENAQGGGRRIKIKDGGDMPNVEVPPETPQEAAEKAQGGKGGKKDAEKKDVKGKDAGSGEGDSKEDKPTNGKDGATGDKSGKVSSEKKDGGDGKEGAGETGDKKEKNNGKPKPGKGEGQTIAQLLEEKEKLERGELEDDRPPIQQAGSSSESPESGGKAGSSRGASRPKVGDWKDYQACVAKYGPEIRQARALLVHIQEKQAKVTQRPTYKRELLPEDGDMDGRFDAGAHEKMMTRLITGQKVTEDDARRFVVDEEKKTPASIDIVLHIDGSGSMYSPMSSRGTQWEFSPIEAGIQTACIINEAAKKPRNHANPKGKEGDINVWTNVWGNDPPLLIAKPGDDSLAVAKAISGLKESQGWGTELAPAIVHTTKQLAEHKADPNMPVGFTHHIIISDGDIGDPATALLKIDKLLQGCSQTTVDVVIIQEGDTKMDEVIRRAQTKYGEARVKLVHCNNPANAHSDILALLRDRMMATGYSKAIPYRDRQRDFQKTYATMEL